MEPGEAAAIERSKHQPEALARPLGRGQRRLGLVQCDARLAGESVEAGCQRRIGGGLAARILARTRLGDPVARQKAAPRREITAQFADDFDQSDTGPEPLRKAAHGPLVGCFRDAGQAGQHLLQHAAAAIAIQRELGVVPAGRPGELALGGIHQYPKEKAEQVKAHGQSPEAAKQAAAAAELAKAKAAAEVAAAAAHQQKHFQVMPGLEVEKIQRQQAA